jgi:hypothetical protein
LKLCRGTEKAKSAACWLAVQASEVMRGGENVLSQGVSTRGYVPEVTDVRLPRKALTTLTSNCPYPKPTQVGRLRIPKGAR